MINIDYSKHLVFYSNVKFISGIKNSILIDIQRHDYWNLNELEIYFIKMAMNKRLLNVINRIREEELEKFKVFIDSALKNDLMFLTSNPDRFPQISNYWNEPFIITNLIIDVRIDTFDILKNYLLNFVNSNYIKFAQVRFYFSIDFLKFKDFIKFLFALPIGCFEFILCFDSSFTNDKLFELTTTECDKISLIQFYNATENNTMHFRNDNLGFIQMNSKVSSISEKSCGLVTKSFFTINMKNYTESEGHNSCLNRKISIDSNGDIKNCPSMKESYGNIKDTTLEEAIEKPGFKKYWNINKDQIAVCKDCEFRYICTDCRAYVEDPHDTSGPEGTNLSQPLKCGYNPYTGEWAEWSTNLLKQKAIDFYGMREMVKGMNISENDSKGMNT